MSYFNIINVLSVLSCDVILVLPYSSVLLSCLVLLCSASLHVVLCLVMSLSFVSAYLSPYRPIILSGLVCIMIYCLVSFVFCFLYFLSLPVIIPRLFTDFFHCEIIIRNDWRYIGSIIIFLFGVVFLLCYFSVSFNVTFVFIFLHRFKLNGGR